LKRCIPKVVLFINNQQTSFALHQVYSLRKQRDNQRLYRHFLHKALDEYHWPRVRMMTSSFSFYKKNHAGNNPHQQHQPRHPHPTDEQLPTTDYRNFEECPIRPTRANDDDSFWSTASTKLPFVLGQNRQENNRNDNSNGINRHRILLREYSSHLLQQQHQTHHYHPRAVLKTLFSTRGGGDDQDWKDDLNQKHSYLYIMLHPKSTEWHSELFKHIICAIIVVDLIIFAMSTEPALQEYHVWFLFADGLTSTIFLIEYIVRLVTATENKKYADLGPVVGRLRYMVSYSAIIDALATLPFFLQLAMGWHEVPTTYLRVFRVLRILRTDGYSRAMGACYRVVYYNREILSVAMLVCLFLILVTSVALYYFRPPDDGNSDYDSTYGGEFRSIPATLYLSVLILTGQDQFVRDSQGMPWYTKAVVAMTGSLSIAMYAIPVSLLTWGFEAEAERCARKARKSMKYAQSSVTQRGGGGCAGGSTSGGSGGMTKPSRAPSPVLVNPCNSDEEYQRIIAREVSNGALPTSPNSCFELPQSPISLSATSNVKELVDTFLRNDHSGMGVEALTEFLTHKLQIQCQRNQFLPHLPPQSTQPPPPELSPSQSQFQTQAQPKRPNPINNAQASLSSFDSWVIGENQMTVDVSTRINTLEFSVGVMHSKLDQLCQLFLMEQETGNGPITGTAIVPLPPQLPAATLSHSNHDWVATHGGGPITAGLSSSHDRGGGGEGRATPRSMEPSHGTGLVQTGVNSSIYRPIPANTLRSRITRETDSSRFASHGSW
jgi:voltage-gated potassium channel